jgi:FkbM family methyltransferase
MNLKKLYRRILRRPFFIGQYRIFNYLFKKGYLSTENKETVKPLNGNFFIKCNTKTWIGAQIVYLGEYEDYIKNTFKQNINNGDLVLDIGANIGFHTLYFADLVGKEGKVIAFEPIPSTFSELFENTQLNNFDNIELKNIALGNETKQLSVHIDIDSNNPGANNLFINGNTKIDCKQGDNVLGDLKVDFIKIDVEGYELYVLQGLSKLIENHKPKIVFEYDKNYQLKNNDNALAIFDFLNQFNYSFFEINRGRNTKINDLRKLNSADILALPL